MLTSETGPPMKQTNRTMLRNLLNMMHKSSNTISMIQPSLQIIWKKMRKKMKTSHLQTMMMMTQIMKTKMMHDKTRIKIHHQFSLVE
eukprot:15344922-Ditylum_brightwellii.AAC.1